MAQTGSIRDELRASRPQKVAIKLPIDKTKPKSLLVSVNGVRYAIERGKQVEVPWAVAQVIEQSVAADEAVEMRIRHLTANPNVAVI